MQSILKIELRGAFEVGHIFSSVEEAEAAKMICAKYGERLKVFEDPTHHRSYPLGFGDSSLLFGTAYNTPNNTLPIFWSTVTVEAERAWVAPYPRAHKQSRTPPPLSSIFILEHKMHEGHQFGVNLVVPSIAKYQRFKPALLASEIRCALVEPKEFPPELLEYYRNGLDERVNLLRSKGKSVEINKGYSLHSARIDKVQIDEGGRKHIPYLEFEPADYSHQIMFGERISEPDLIKTPNGDVSIREIIERDKAVSFEHFDWALVKHIPIPQRFANVVGLVVQRDINDPGQGRCLIACLRSKAMAVSEEEKDLNIWQATMSCAEGMLRPDDANMVEGAAPSPFNTAMRALRQELGIKLGRDYKESDLKMLALAYDSKRCQPVACFLLEILDLDYEMVENLWNREAEDNNESPAVFPVPISPAGLSAFLRGDFVWQGRTTRMFSNHQQIGLCALAEHYFDVKSLAV